MRMCVCGIFVWLLLYHYYFAHFSPACFYYPPEKSKSLFIVIRLKFVYCTFLSILFLCAIQHIIIQVLFICIYVFIPISVKRGWSESTKNIPRKIPYYKSLRVTRPFYLRTSPVNIHTHTQIPFAGNRVEKIKLLIWFYHEKTYYLPTIHIYVYIYYII